jgi:hypothetical protein
MKLEIGEVLESVVQVRKSVPMFCRRRNYFVASSMYQCHRRRIQLRLLQVVVVTSRAPGGSAQTD